MGDLKKGQKDARSVSGAPHPAQTDHDDGPANRPRRTVPTSAPATPSEPLDHVAPQTDVTPEEEGDEG